MVRGLVGTMVRVGRGLISIEQFHQIIQSQDCTQADFTTPAQGLFLVQVNYPEDLLLKKL
jgi:tRNA pseudouridine38-40 synthase